MQRNEPEGERNSERKGVNERDQQCNSSEKESRILIKRRERDMKGSEVSLQRKCEDRTSGSTDKPTQDDTAR